MGTRAPRTTSQARFVRRASRRDGASRVRLTPDSAEGPQFAHQEPSPATTPESPGGSRGCGHQHDAHQSPRPALSTRVGVRSTRQRTPSTPPGSSPGLAVAGGVPRRVTAGEWSGWTSESSGGPGRGPTRERAIALNPHNPDQKPGTGPVRAADPRRGAGSRDGNGTTAAADHSIGCSSDRMVTHYGAATDSASGNVCARYFCPILCPVTCPPNSSAISAQDMPAARAACTARSSAVSAR